VLLIALHDISEILPPNYVHSAQILVKIVRYQLRGVHHVLHLNICIILLVWTNAQRLMLSLSIIPVMRAPHCFNFVLLAHRYANVCSANLLKYF
jgi:hypothetical protein